MKTSLASVALSIALSPLLGSPDLRIAAPVADEPQCETVDQDLPLWGRPALERQIAPAIF